MLKKKSKLGKYILVAAFATATLATAVGSVAALNNENRSVKRVEVLDSGRVYIELTSEHTTPPCNSPHRTLMVCLLTEPYCEPAMKLALSAQLAGKTVDYELDGSCISDVPRFSRFRVK